MSFRSFFGFGKGRKSQSQSSKRSLRMEALEERALLSAAPLSTSEYADLCDQYAEFNLPANMADLNVITLDLAQGDGLSQLKSAISTAGTTTKSDLIVVRTFDSANTLTYSTSSDQLAIDINASQYGSVTIVGLGSQSFTLNANQKCSGMVISGSATIANLGGMTFTNGRGDVTGISDGVETTDGGGIRQASGLLTLSNSTVSGNSATYGGGIYSSKYSTLTINNCKISNNTASSYTSSNNTAAGSNGGGINSRGVLTVTNSELTGNTAIYGGGILVSESTATLTLTGSTLSGNTASFNGGGIANFGTCTIADCTISNNSSTGSESTTYNSPGGAGIYNQGMMEVSNSSIKGNTSQYVGGGIYNRYTLTVSNSIIHGNTASEGGGGFYNDGYDNTTVLTINDCAITGNSVTNGYGGGIRNNGDKATVTISNSEVSGNTANYSGSSYGGGIYNGLSSTFNVIGCTILNNTADQGGGIYIYKAGTVSIDRSKISNNSASNSGGGIWIRSQASVSITNSIISDNQTTYYGGIISESGLVTVTNCTITGNAAGGVFAGQIYNSIIVDNNGSDVYGSGVTGYNNLSTYTSWSGSGNITYNNVSPFVNAANGDYRLAAGSQAIGKGSNTYASNAGLTSSSKDLAGASRIVNSTIDIGAYEFQGVELQGVIYNANDIAHLQAFLEQTNSSGQKNGITLNSSYNKDNPSSWTGVTWTEVGGIKCVSRIDWMNKRLVGSLDMSGSTSLTYLRVWDNNLTSLNVRGCTALTDLNCVANELTSLDVSQNTALTSLNCWGNDLTSLDVSKNTALKSLYCYSNQLTSLDVSNNTELTALYCSSNHLTELNVSVNTALMNLECYSNQLTELDVSNNTALTTLNCSSNLLTALDASNSTALTTLNCSSNQLTELNISNNMALKSLNCSSNQLDELDVSDFTAMTLLNCSDNQLTELDVSHNTALTTLECADIQLTVLDISHNTALTTLNCSSNQLTELDISNNTALKTLRCFSNQLSELDVTNHPSISLLYCYDNHLAELDLLDCPSILYLSVGDTTENVYLNLPPDNGWIDISVNSSGESSSDWSFIDSEGNTLNTGSRYYMRSTDTLPIFAQNETSGKSIAFSSTPSLQSPTLTVQTLDSNSVTVTVGEVDNASGYTLEYATRDDFSDATSQDVSAGSTVITGLNANTTYYFRTFAIGSDDYSNSDYSETASATTLAEPVTVNAVVNACIVFRDTLTTDDIAAELPTGVSSIRAGKTVYAEIWVKDVENTDPAIVGGYLNLLYDNDALTVQDVTYGTVFNSLTGYQTFEDGKISTIGGVTATGVLDKGDDEWVRLATVSFIAETEGSTTVTLGAPENNTHNLTRTDALTLSNDQIFYGSADLDITAACPMDIDGDGYIAVSDYAQLSRAWFSSPGSANWNPACDFDGDGVVAVSDYAILSRNWLKSVDDPDLYFPVVNASPAAAVGSELIVSPYNQIAYSDNAVVDVRLAAVSTKSASDSASDVPASLEQVAPGDSFFVEIWVRNFNGYENSTLCGLTGGYVNMSYNSDLLSVDGVTYGSVFSQLNNMQNASTPGYIDTIGGTVSPGVMDKGDDEWVRLATVAFTATGGEGDAAIESLAPSITPYNLTLTSGKTLKNDEIDFGSLNLSISSSLGQLSTPTLTASATGYNSVSVTVGSVEHASTYTVEYSTSDDFANASTKTFTAGTTAITGLTAETTYYFRAFANGSGDYSNSNYSETTSATTLAAPVLDAEVNARVVFRDSLTTVDTSAELPEGISSIRATKTVYAEIWVKDVEDADPAIVGGYLNVLYDNDALTVQEVTYGDVFSQMTGYQTYEDGAIATVGGVTDFGVLDKGDDEWVRLATVTFVADMEGFTTVSLGAPNDYHDNLTRTDGVILSNGQIDYGVTVLEVTAACPMDIDGDGYIGVSDYSLLSKAWRSSPGKDNWDPACDIDGDGYVGVSDYTYLSRNWRKYATDPDLVYPDAPSSPSAQVSEVVVGVFENQPVLEPEPVAVSAAASAAVEENSGDLNNPVALEADETVNVRLTAVSSKTASDVAADVPASMTEINPGDSFFVEIWVRNFNGYEGTTLCGLTGGYLNVSYPSDLLTAGNITYGSVFSQLNNLQEEIESGLIDLIGGVARTGVLDKGDDEWVRLATVAFTASEKGDALVESLPPTDSHDNLTLTSGKTLKNDEISFGSLTLSIGSIVIQLTVQNDFVKTTLNNPVVIDYRENDTVSDWSETTVQFGDASYGEYAVNADGTISYTPEDGFYGTDAVSYAVVAPSGELATGAIVISVGLPIAASVQTTAGSHSPTSAMAASIPSVTDWDDCYVELWAQGVTELNPGETTLTLEYNPAVYDAPTFSACADGVALTVSQSSVLPNGNVQVELTAQVSEALASQTDNLFLGTVVLTPSMDEDAGVVGSAVPVIGLDGSESSTTVKAMPYDLIRNGAVDVNDFVAFATVYGYVPSSVSPENPLYAQTVKADFNNDGNINVDDFVLFAINYGATKKTADKPAAQGALQVQSEELVILTAESDNSQFETSSAQLINDSRVESVQTLRQAHSSALLDLYDNQNGSDVTAELSAPAIDAALYQDDDFDFLFDETDSDSADSSDVDLALVLDELELEFA
ncbi:MAG: right-handed parallel beta-helix repeat-containing protein [Thermoguttaceae bacterium]|nr:right-handed parallel beta-helix repeat-containing protein [Thermoguttaceae bacterium]